jgi:hypothetical protein
MKKLWTGHKIYHITDSVNPLTSKCEFDLGGRGAGVVPDILSYYCDYLCQVISKSRRSYTKYTLKQMLTFDLSV